MYKLGQTYLQDKAYFYQTHIDYINEQNDWDSHYEIITVCGSIDYDKKSSRKLAKKIVKLLNKDLEKSQKNK